MKFIITLALIVQAVVTLKITNLKGKYSELETSVSTLEKANKTSNETIMKVN